MDMFGIDNYASFILAITAFQLFPGAGTITILNATARGGVVIGLATVLGTITGDFVYMFAAALGLAAVLGAHPNILATAQWVGVGYLCWVGWKIFRSSTGSQADASSLNRTARSYFGQGLAVSLTKPKVIFFFMAFFPLFLSTESNPAVLFTLILHVTAMSLLFQTGLVFIGNVLARYLSNWKYARLVAHRVAGAALIGFGVKLAFDNR